MSFEPYALPLRRLLREHRQSSDPVKEHVQIDELHLNFFCGFALWLDAAKPCLMTRFSMRVSVMLC